MKLRTYNPLYTLFVLLLSFPFFTKAQNAFLEEKNINLAIKPFYQKEEHKVILRWLPKNYYTWDLANKRGYYLRRLTIERDGKKLPDDEIAGTIQTWNFNVASPDAFASSGNKNIELAGEAVYSPNEFKIEAFNENPLIKAKNQEEERLTRAMMNLLATDLDIKAAELMGMFFVDQKVEPNCKYRYIVNLYKIDQEERRKSQSGICDVDAQKENTQLPDIEILGAEGGDSLAIIKWKNPTEQWFNAYNIFRDGEKINTEPFMFSSENPNAPITYLDKLPENNRAFKYQIQGLTSFGIDGQISEDVIIIGKPKPLAAIPSILDLGDVGGSINLRWEFPMELRELIKGFVVRRSNAKEGTYTDVSPILDRGEENFTDPSPSPTNYYAVVAIDENNNELVSTSALALLEDNTPPAAPTGAVGIMTEDGNTTITWSPNTEEDLAGYQVFVSNHANGEYVSATTNKIKQTNFYYYISTNTLNEKVYFKVAAYDFRENRSELSVPIEVSIPDVVPPSAPIMTKTNPIANGIQLKWAKSSSADVTKHEIQRKGTNESDWKIIQTIDVSNPIPADSMLDATGELLQVYDYRIVAFDEAGLSAPSRILRTQNIAGGFRPDILNTIAFEDKQLKYYYQNAGSMIGADANAVPIEGYVKLYWEYPMSKNIYDFQIYRAIAKEPAILLKSVNYEDALFRGSVTIPNPANPTQSITLGNTKNGQTSTNSSNTTNTNGLIYQGTKGGFNIYLNPSTGQIVQVPINNSGTNTTTNISNATGSFFGTQLEHTSTTKGYIEYTEKATGSTILIPSSIYGGLSMTTLTYSYNANDYDYYYDAQNKQRLVQIPTANTPKLLNKGVVGNATIYYDTAGDMTLSVANSGTTNGGVKGGGTTTTTPLQGSLVGHTLAFSTMQKGYYEYVDKSTGAIVGIPTNLYPKLTATTLIFENILKLKWFSDKR